MLQKSNAGIQDVLLSATKPAIQWHNKQNDKLVITSHMRICCHVDMVWPNNMSHILMIYDTMTLLDVAISV